jgi:hypothetical protein
VGGCSPVWWRAVDRRLVALHLSRMRLNEVCTGSSCLAGLRDSGPGPSPPDVRDLWESLEQVCRHLCYQTCARSRSSSGGLSLKGSPGQVQVRYAIKIPGLGVVRPWRRGHQATFSSQMGPSQMDPSAARAQPQVQSRSLHPPVVSPIWTGIGLAGQWSLQTRLPRLRLTHLGEELINPDLHICQQASSVDRAKSIAKCLARPENQPWG